MYFFDIFIITASAIFKLLDDVWINFFQTVENV